jgi:hypothetical protein
MAPFSRPGAASDWKKPEGTPAAASHVAGM